LLPEQKVMFAGDLAFSGGHPIFMEGSMLGFKKATQRMRELGPDVLLPGHGPVCRGDDVGRVLDELEAYCNWIADVAVASYAAGLTPLEAAHKALQDSPYAELPESERVVCNLHRAYAELTDYEPTLPLTIPNLWPEMVALHGGPILSHA
jgi:cyclase